MALVHWVDGDHFDALRDKINEIVDAVNGIVSVPIGGIQMYFGSPADSAKWDSSGIGVAGTQYENFALCLGQGLTGSELQNFAGDSISIAPDFRGKFPAGYDTSNAKFPTIGFEGGEDEVTLTADQSGLRDHVHGVSAGNTNIHYDSGGSGGSPNYDSSLANPSGGVLNVDGDSSRDGAQDALEAHNNLPPYMATGFIIRYK